MLFQVRLCLCCRHHYCVLHPVDRHTLVMAHIHPDTHAHTHTHTHRPYILTLSLKHDLFPTSVSLLACVLHNTRVCVSSVCVSRHTQAHVCSLNSRTLYTQTVMPPQQLTGSHTYPQSTIRPVGIFPRIKLPQKRNPKHIPPAPPKTYTTLLLSPLPSGLVLRCVGVSYLMAKNFPKKQGDKSPPWDFSHTHTPGPGRSEQAYQRLKIEKKHFEVMEEIRRTLMLFYVNLIWTLHSSLIRCIRQSLMEWTDWLQV